MPKIIVLGAGIGGISMAYELRSLVGRTAEITVLSDTSYFHFVPSNPWVALDWRRPEDIKVPLQETLDKFAIGFDDVGAKHVRPEQNEIELKDGRILAYDYLVIATGPALAFDEIDGLGPDRNSVSICHVDHAAKAAERWRHFCDDPGPIVVGAVQGASCFGPAYEFAFLANADLRKRKIRDRVPMTFVTSEPYIGHLGLGGVGDTKGILESGLRNRDIRWITNAKIDRVTPDAVEITELTEDGHLKRQHHLPSKLTMMIPAFRGVDCLMGGGRQRHSATRQSARLCRCRQVPAQPDLQECFCGRGLHRDRTLRADAGSGRRAQDGLYDRVDGHRRRREHPSANCRWGGCARTDLERRLSGGFW